jgi:hypothetical protein
MDGQNNQAWAWDIYMSFERGRNENLKKTWKGHLDFAEKRGR